MKFLTCLVLLTPLLRGGIIYTAAFDTSGFVGHAAGPFYLNFQLNDGSGVIDRTNVASMRSFQFGGGQASSSSMVIGGASGDLRSTVTLTDTNFLNSFTQEFLPGSLLIFRLELTTRVDVGPVPDQFSMAILDSTGSEIPTAGLYEVGSDVLLLIDINAPYPLIRTFGADLSRSPLAGGPPINFAAPSRAIVPEPGTWLLVGGGIAAVVLRKRRPWLLLTVFGLLGLRSATAQTVSFIDQFYALPASGSGAVEASHVVVRSDGIYVSGSVFGKLPGQTGTGFPDGYLRKYDHHGSVAWTRQFAVTPYDETWVTAMLNAPDGVYVAGYNESGNDITVPFLRRYDAFGNALWTREIPSAVVSQDGKGIYALRFLSGFQISVHKYDVDGNLMWARQPLTPSTERVGWTTGFVVSGNALYVNGVYEWDPAIQNRRTFLRKYDSEAMRLLWENQSTDTAWISVQPPHLYFTGDSGLYLKQCDLDGNETWRRSLAGFRFTDAVADATGVYVFGSFTNDARQYVRKYNVGGDIVFTRALDVTIQANWSELTADSTGVYLVGGIAGWAGQSGTLPGQYTPNRDYDGFLVIMDDVVAPHPPDCAMNSTHQLSVTRGGFRFNFVTHRYTQTVTVKNTSALPVQGPLSIAVDGLNLGATVTNPAGFTSCGVLMGNPYVLATAGSDHVLSPGESATAVVEFSNPTNEDIRYSLRVLAGSPRR